MKMKGHFNLDIILLWTLCPGILLIASGYQENITTTPTNPPTLVNVSNSTNSSIKVNLRQDEDGDGDGDGEAGGGDGVTNFLQAAINIIDRFQPTTRATTLNPLGSFLGFESNGEFNTFSNGLSGFLLLANGAGNVLQQSFNRTRPRNETSAIAAQISNAINLFNTLNTINQQQQTATTLPINEETVNSNVNEVTASATSRPMSSSFIPQQIFRATTRPPQTLIEVGYAGLLNFLAGGIRRPSPAVSNSGNFGRPENRPPPPPPPSPRTTTSAKPTFPTTETPIRQSTISPEESIYLFLKNRFFSSTTNQPLLSESPSEASLVIENLDVEIHSPEMSHSQSPPTSALPTPKSTKATTTAASISTTNRHYNFHNVQRLTHPTKKLETITIQTTTTPRTRVVTPAPGKPIYWMNMYYPNGLPAAQS